VAGPIGAAAGCLVTGRLRVAVVLRRVVDFRPVVLRRTVDFRPVVLRRAVVFRRVVFRRPVDFRPVVFLRAVVFRRVVLRRAVDFRPVVFRRVVLFRLRVAAAFFAAALLVADLRRRVAAAFFAAVERDVRLLAVAMNASFLVTNSYHGWSEANNPDQLSADPSRAAASGSDAACRCMSRHGSPERPSRRNRLRTEKRVGLMRPSSSHLTGVATGAPGRARTAYGGTAVCP
jgi:hypothetical protein